MVCVRNVRNLDKAPEIVYFRDTLSKNGILPLSEHSEWMRARVKPAFTKVLLQACSFMGRSCEFMEM